MKRTLQIEVNGRQAELRLLISDNHGKIGVYASVGFVTVTEDGYSYVSHIIRQDFARIYNNQPRPARVTAKFKTTLLESVDIEKVMADVLDFYI